MFGYLVNFEYFIREFFNMFNLLVIANYDKILNFCSQFSKCFSCFGASYNHKVISYNIWKTPIINAKRTWKDYPYPFQIFVDN